MRHLIAALLLLAACDKKDVPPAAPDAAPVAVVEAAAPPDHCSGADVDLYDAMNDRACAMKPGEKAIPPSSALTMKVTPAKASVIGRLPVDFDVEITNGSDAVVPLDLLQRSTTPPHDVNGFSVGLKGEDPVFELTNGPSPTMRVRVAPHGRARAHFKAPILVYKTVDQNLEVGAAKPGVHALVIGAPIPGNAALTGTASITVESAM